MTINNISSSLLLEKGEKTLKQTSPTPRLDSEILLANIMKIERIHFYSKEIFPNRKEVQEYNKNIKKRAKGMPIAYLIGSKEFWSLNMQVNKYTLIPRPETEHLVELGLSHLVDLKKDYNILELGTGCGAIAIALAHERPHAKIYATDISVEAIRSARDNAKCLNVENIQFMCSNWFEAIRATKFDLIVSNPPYVNEKNINDYNSLSLSYEPKIALFSDNNGLNCMNIIIGNSIKYLENNGWLMIEHGYDQAHHCRQFMTSVLLQNIHTNNDLSGKHRVTEGQKTKLTLTS
jgi:release factor glutamine methyltransferase